MLTGILTLQVSVMLICLLVPFLWKQRTAQRGRKHQAAKKVAEQKVLVRVHSLFSLQVHAKHCRRYCCCHVLTTDRQAQPGLARLELGTATGRQRSQIRLKKCSEI